MLLNFLFLNIEFSLNVFSIFVFFMAGWLYWDSYKTDRNSRALLLKSLGFTLLSIYCIFRTLNPIFPVLIFLMEIIKLSGLITIAKGLFSEPILKAPINSKHNAKDGSENSVKNSFSSDIPNLISDNVDNTFQKNSLSRRKPKKNKGYLLFLPFSLSGISLSLKPLSMALYLIISLRFIRRSFEGLDRQLKLPAFSFLLLFFADLLGLFFIIKTDSVFWSVFFSQFSPYWWLYKIIEFTGLLIFGIWIWGYIRFRLQSQLFIATLFSTIVIFIVTTFSFSFLTLNNIERDTYDHLKTDVNVFHYSMERLQSELLAKAQAIAENQNIIDNLKNSSKNDLYNQANSFMLSYGLSSVIISDNTGKVLTNGENQDISEENISQSILFIRAFEKNPISIIEKSKGTLTPVIEIKASFPIYEKTDPNKPLGVLITAYKIDEAFVDGLKSVTGLDATVFSDNIKSATTLTHYDGKTRLVGMYEENKKIKDTVLLKGKLYSSQEEINNRPFYSVYSPLKTDNEKIIGMISVGKPQIIIFETARNSLNVTFAISLLLIILSIIPSYLFSRFLESHLQA